MHRDLRLINGRFELPNATQISPRRKSDKLANAISGCLEQLELRRMLSVDPIALPGGPYTVNEGGSVVISGLESSDPDGSVASYKWDLDYDPANGFSTDRTGGSFTFNGPDGPLSRTIALRVTDQDGDTDTQTTTLAVAPTVAITGAPEASVSEGAALKFGSDVTDASDDDLTYGWTVKKNGGHYMLPDGTEITSNDFEFTPDDNGTYAVRLTVEDADGGSTTVNTDSITVTNAAPTATITGQPNGKITEGTEVVLTAHSSDAGSADSFSYTWSVKKDGEEFPVLAPAAENVFHFTPRDNGEFVVSCVVSDDDGANVTVTSETVVVTNANPTATILGEPDDGIVEGTAVNLSINVSDAGEDDTFAYSWSVTRNGNAYDLGDDAVTNQQTFSFTPNDEGTYVAKCEVRDDDGGKVSPKSSSIGVANAAPITTISGAPQGAIEEGAEVALIAQATDAGSTDVVSYSWTVTKDGEKYDLGEVATDTAELKFTPNDNGEYAVTLAVSDGDGGDIELDSIVVTVTNIAPAVGIDGMPQGEVLEGAPIAVSANVTDAGSGDTVGAYGWTVKKDGKHYVLPEGADIASERFAFTPADNGSYAIRLTVVDDDGGSTTFNSDAITVANAAPTARIVGEPEGSIVEGTEVTLTAGANDAGVDDTFSFSWSVTKNGEPYPLSRPQALVFQVTDNFTFTPNDEGDYVVTCVVTDNDGASAVATSETITVTNTNPTAAMSGEPEGLKAEGVSVALNVEASDVGADDTLAYAWTVTKDDETYALDDEVVTSKASLAFNANDNGTFVVTCVVSDGDDGSVTIRSKNIIVANIDPSVTVLVPFTGVRGRLTDVNLSIVDAPRDSHAVTWNWGDGTATETIDAGTNDTLNAQHIFGETGTYNVTVTTDDGDGGVVISETTVTIKHAAMQPDPINPENMALVVTGTSGDDEIAMSLNDNNRIKVTLNGATLGTYAPSGHVIAYGDGGQNVIALDNSIVSPAVIFGGDGRDIVNGGSGDDVIIGGPGDDALHGNGGRDILIGGLGADVTEGGDDDDILISGSAPATESFNSLRAVTAEWTSANTVFTDRVKHLKGALAGGLNGSTKLTTGTVYEDADPDALTGGTGRDWFFASGEEALVEVTTDDFVTDTS